MKPHQLKMTRRLMRRVKKNMSRVLTEKPARQTCIFKETPSQTLAKLLADLSERLIRGKVRPLRARHGI